MTRSNLALLGGGLVIALLVVVALAPRSSSDPDGLERVAEDEGFAEQAAEAPFRLFPDYSVPGVGDGAASTILAGAIGVIAATALTLLAARWLRLRSRRSGGRGETSPPGVR